MTTSSRRLYAAVAACAIVVHLGALWNRWAFDDVYIIPLNPLVHSPAGVWRAFLQPYWPPDFGGSMYRPLVIASFALDWMTQSLPWFHLVNVAWHAGASVVVAALARHWSGEKEGAGVTAALVAGLVFAVHPVHVEAVANVVGRNELMAGLFTLLGVYAALVRQSVGLSAAAIAGGLLSKENAAVAPALIAWAWIVGAAPKPATRGRLLAFVGSWLALAAVYLLVRWVVLHPYARFHGQAPVFVFESALTVRLTALAALADVGRLLVFPLTLRVDYSPAERTAVTSPFDGRFALGLLVFAIWAGLLVLAWRRGRRLEAYGLGWIAIAFLPVANLLFPTGVLVAERTLYLPSAGLALALGAWLRDLPAQRLRTILGILVVAGGVRSAVRVPVWRDDLRATLSIFTDSPRSYRGPARMLGVYLATHRPERALEAARLAITTFDRDPMLYMSAATAALTAGRAPLADTLFAQAERLCTGCVGYYRFEAAAARARGDSAVADSLLARVRRLEHP
jgi:hypothetical protein